MQLQILRDDSYIPTKYNKLKTSENFFVDVITGIKISCKPRQFWRGSRVIFTRKLHKLASFFKICSKAFQKQSSLKYKNQLTTRIPSARFFTIQQKPSGNKVASDQRHVMQCGCRPEPAESPRTVPLQFGLGSPRIFGRGPCGVGVGRAAGWMIL